MDIIGAKALKDRLGQHAVDVAPPASVEVAAEAPPVYRWLGVAWTEPRTPLVDDDEPATAA